ncbi:MAG: chemotaxis response regulator protein-glutamate methylesterase [Gemmatimonadetes bacterium GWC2_71_10]|nr:MAG: chemotaxis response regulator protein-glutamate methylesterase [Gemmatimonadetes bacterium GWC2_71_10]
MIRVVVAEDSLTVRELLVGILESDPEFRVVGQAKTGAEAVELAIRLRPDLITMDVHMPALDGFEATKEIMVHAPAPIIIVSSSASQADVELSFNTMRAGALMVVAKPDNPQSPLFNGRREQFVAMAKAMAQVKVVRRWATQTLPATAPASRRRASGPPLQLVAMAASTGGPAALQRILADLPGDFPAPILIVQHIATGFVAGLAGWLGGACNLHVKVAEAGDPLVGHTVLIAPDDRHLGIAQGRAVLSDAPPLGGFRPSATHLFETAARAYGASLAAIVLTGMGSDGVAGLAAVKTAGGRVLAQDEASSVVFGMPREAVVAGLADEVLPVGGIADWLREQATQGAP